MANYEFPLDLIEGEKGEVVVKEFLENKGFTFISDNKDNRYDIIMEFKGEQKKYEIKTDVLCKPGINPVNNKPYDTGNLFVENESRGKNSGVLVTEAEWYVTYFKHLNELWFINTKELINICITNNDGFISGGDKGSNTKGYLLKRERLRDKFKVYTI